MKLIAVLARHGIFSPPKAKVEAFLQHLGDGLRNEDLRSFDAFHRKLPVMSTVHGFFADVVLLVSPCLHSRNSDVVSASLGAVEVIICKYGKKLSTFSLTCLLNQLLQLHKQDQSTWLQAKRLLFKMIRINPNYSLYSFERIMAVCDEDLHREILILLLQYVMTVKKLNRILVTDGCRIAVEGLMCPSSVLRLAAFDLVYALWYRGAPKDVLLRFFAKKASDEVASAVKARLQRRYKPPLLTRPVPQPDLYTDQDLMWAEKPSVRSADVF